MSFDNTTNPTSPAAAGCPLPAADSPASSHDQRPTTGDSRPTTHDSSSPSRTAALPHCGTSSPLPSPATLTADPAALAAVIAERQATEELVKLRHARSMLKIFDVLEELALDPESPARDRRIACAILVRALTPARQAPANSNSPAPVPAPKPAPPPKPVPNYVEPNGAAPGQPRIDKSTGRPHTPPDLPTYPIPFIPRAHIPAKPTIDLHHSETLAILLTAMQRSTPEDPSPFNSIAKAWSTNWFECNAHQQYGDDYAAFLLDLCPHILGFASADLELIFESTRATWLVHIVTPAGDRHSYRLSFEYWKNAGLPHGREPWKLGVCGPHPDPRSG